MNKQYVINNLSNTTSSAYWLDMNGMEFQYRANNGTVEIHDGGEWVQATFTSEDEANRIAREINARIPAKIMRWESVMYQAS